MFREDIINSAAARELGLAHIAKNIDEKDDLAMLLAIFDKIKEEYKTLEDQYDTKLPYVKSVFVDAVLGTSYDSLRWELDVAHDLVCKDWPSSLDIIKYNKLTRSLRLAVQSYLHTKYRELADDIIKFMDDANIPEEFKDVLRTGSYPLNILVPIAREYEDSLLDRTIFYIIIRKMIYAMAEYTISSLPETLRYLKTS